MCDIVHCWTIMQFWSEKFKNKYTNHIIIKEWDKWHKLAGFNVAFDIYPEQKNCGKQMDWIAKWKPINFYKHEKETSIE